jgi:DNA mismatch endonuclease (patch repair protein)
VLSAGFPCQDLSQAGRTAGITGKQSNLISYVFDLIERLRFRVDRPVVPGRRRADIVLARARLAVYVDGCFWHACPQHASWPKANAVWWRRKIEANVSRDRETDRTLAAAGWTVRRFWAHEDAELAARVVARVVQRTARRELRASAAS